MNNEPMKSMRKKWSGGVLESWKIQPPSDGADLRGKFIGLFRDVSRFIAFYRTEEARNSAFSRILSIRGFFAEGTRSGSRGSNTCCLESTRRNDNRPAKIKTERSRMFAYVRLKSRMFSYFEKKYFFPALWPRC